MVVVKLRETYDLHTVKNKMTVIGIHTPKPDILKANYPGLLMQCRAYRPLKASVGLACASVLPLDPKGVGLTENDVAPEDLFNPILYKPITNFGMSQLEARIAALTYNTTQAEVDGSTAMVDVDTVTNAADEFSIYYGLLANSQGWRKANPQQGLQMKDIRPLVYEMVYNVGDTDMLARDNFASPNQNGSATSVPVVGIRGNAKPMPMIPCLCYDGNARDAGFDRGSPQNLPGNAEQQVAFLKVLCGAIIIPPSRLHELFYRMVVEWEVEFSMIRPVGEITNWVGLGLVGNATHYQNYSFENTKKALGSEEVDIMDRDTAMVSANVDIEKVM